jgi:myosin heavy subunit
VTSNCLHAVRYCFVVSVGSQFRTSLKSLVADLERTQPHYIRCVKPNLVKSANKFMSGEVLKQLRYSGMMEAIRIRQEGYALREEHNSFFEQYSVLLTNDYIPNGTEDRIVHLVRILSERLGVSDVDWQVGHSKIFLRRELSEKLERLARLRVQSAARTLTRFGSRVVSERMAVFLVIWVKFRLTMIGKRKLRRASAKINALYRGSRQRRKYRNCLRAVVRLQAQQRRVAAVHRCKKLVDPFYDMNYAECKKLLASEQNRLDKAVVNQNFKVATELSASMYVRYRKLCRN